MNTGPNNIYQMSYFMNYFTFNLVDKFNDTVRYGTTQYGTVRYRINLIYVPYFTSNHEICAGRRPLPLL